MAEHSKYFAPSALSRRIACPGSALLEAELKDVPNKAAKNAAQKGSAMHYVCEQCQKFGGEPQEWEGKFAPVEEEDDKVVSIAIDRDMVKCCDRALAMMREITAGHTVETETRVEMPDLPEMFGTVDVLVNEPPTLIVCDYKFGVTGVEVKKNAQLMAYALMAAGENLKKYTEIRLVVIQPKECVKPGAPPLERYEPKVYNVPPQELAEWRDQTLMPAVESIQKARRYEAPPEYHPVTKPMTEPCAWCQGNKYRGDRNKKPVCQAFLEADRYRPA